MRYLTHVAVLFGLACLPAKAAEPPTSWTTDAQRRLAETEYEVTASSGAWQAPNREQGFRTWFGTDGIRIVPRTEQDVPWELTLRLARHGRSEAMQLVPAPTRVDVAANEAALARGGILEGYVNDRHGLEQSFTIPEASAGDGESYLDLELSGMLLPTFSEDGQAAEFKSPEGERVLRYASLRVVDARGRALPARMEGFVEPGLRGLRLRFNDEGAAWTAESDQADADFGISVATAGDVNADGYSDVIVGAGSYDNGQQDEGGAFLYLGSAAGLASAPVWTGESNQAYSGFGTRVAPAGDVNGDGYADVLVGSPNAFSLIFNGRVYLYLGSASGLAATPASILEGDQLFDRFGNSVATAGDVNGDGFADVIVGVPAYDHGQTDEGRAYVYLGSASGLAASPAWTAESDQAGAFFGMAVSTAGDVNGDGYADVIVGASNFDNGESNEGEAFVYLGSATGLSSTAAWTAQGNQVNAGFGYAVATAGDVNGDGYGYADVIVGAPYYTNGDPNEGRAFVYLGSASGLDSTALWFREGGQLNAWFGSWVATAGDVNGDGYADVIVGAPGYSYGQVHGGSVFAYYGGGGDGLDRIPRQARTGAAIPLVLLGKSDSENGFRLQERGRTPAGRGRIRLQYEAKPLGTAFTGIGLGSSPMQSTGTPGAAGSFVNFDESLAGLSEGTFYHWRARVLSTDPFFPRSPWMSMQGNNVTESKLRTAGCLDLDGDGYGAVGDPSCLSLVPDCSINDATIWDTPGESSNVRFMSKTVLSWDVPASPGALTSALVYDTLRSGLASSFLGAICVESDDGPNTTANTASIPSAGQAFYYLNRAQNACPLGVGTLGTTHLGVERAGVSCP